MHILYLSFFLTTFFGVRKTRRMIYFFETKLKKKKYAKMRNVFNLGKYFQNSKLKKKKKKKKKNKKKKN